MALASLCICTGSPEPSLLDVEIRTKISYAGSSIYKYLITFYNSLEKCKNMLKDTGFYTYASRVLYMCSPDFIHK